MPKSKSKPIRVEHRGLPGEQVSRKFGKNRYFMENYNYPTKAKAQQRAKRLRAHGNLARVTTEWSPSGGRYYHHVWYTPTSGRKDAQEPVKKTAQPKPIPPINKRGPRLSGRKPPRITPKRPRLRR